MKHLSKLWILMALISLTIACKEEDDPDPSESITTEEVILSRETAYGEDWIYFSFSQGAELTGINDANYQTDDTWDIAFNRYNVRTNGGSSGAGLAAVYDFGAVDYTSVDEAPTAGYTEDGKIQIVVDPNIGGIPVYGESNGNSLFAGAIIPPSGHPPTYTPNDHIYVVKTADGKYAKVWVKSFYNESGDSGYMNFKYSYQEDGSRILE